MVMAAPATPEIVQNNWAGPGPIVSCVGMERLVTRMSSVQLIGAAHFPLEFGPRGPLNSHGWRSPQRPWKSSQAKGPAGSGCSGRRTTWSGVSSIGALELSQPKPEPCSPQPSQTESP